MAVKKLVTRGLAAVEIAMPNPDGSPGTVFETLGYTDRDSPVTLTEEDPTEDELNAHEIDTALDVEYTAGAKTLELTLVAPVVEVFKRLFGGTITGSGDNQVVSIGNNRAPLDVTLRVLPRKGLVYQSTKTSLWAKINADWAKSSKVGIDITGKVLAADGTNVSEKWGPQVQTIRGGVATATVLNAGDGYTNGSFTDVPVTSSVGEGAKATIVVADGEVTTVTITSPGRGYHTGSVLTVQGSQLGAGTGLSLSIATVA